MHPGEQGDPILFSYNPDDTVKAFVDYGFCAAADPMGTPPWLLDPSLSVDR